MIWSDEQETYYDPTYGGVTVSSQWEQWWEEYSEQQNYWDRMGEAMDRVKKIHPSMRVIKGGK